MWPDAKPRVGVVIPAYNAARYLAEAIESVLRQTFTDFEVVVVDDGSTDATPDIARSFSDPRVRCVRQDNQGLAAARNAGVRAVHGEYLAFLDADDLFLPDKFARQVAALDEQPDAGLVAGGYQYIDPIGRVIATEKPWRSRPILDLENLLLAGLAPVHAVLMRREWSDRVDGFDPQFRMAEDMDFWYRLGLAGCRMAWLPSIVCQYRIHGQNMSRSIDEHYRYLNLALGKVFERPDLPPRIRDLEGRVYALAKLGQAGRLYGTSDFHRAQSRLAEALRRDPSLCSGRGRALAEVIVTWPRSPWARDRQTLLTDVLANLPTGALLPRTLRRTILTTAAMASFYEAFDQGDRPRVRRLWLGIALRAPSWLLNRGNWSILLRSIVPFMTKVRSPLTSRVLP